MQKLINNVHNEQFIYGNMAENCCLTVILSYDADSKYYQKTIF
jgi:hypothetical protein